MKWYDIFGIICFILLSIYMLNDALINIDDTDDYDEDLDDF